MHDRLLESPSSRGSPWAAAAAHRAGVGPRISSCEVVGWMCGGPQSKAKAGIHDSETACIAGRRRVDFPLVVLLSRWRGRTR